jgi:hypothetical protein
MSLDSVRRNGWIQSTADNKDKLNRWLRSCQSIHYQHTEREHAIFRTVQRSRLRALAWGCFRDWKCLALIRVNTDRWRALRILRAMHQRVTFKQHIVRQLGRVYNRSLCVAFARWLRVNNYLRSVHDKQRIVNRRNQAMHYLKRVGIIGRFLMAWIGSLLAAKKARMFMRWKEVTAVSQAIASNLNKSMKRRTFQTWKRAACKRVAIKRFEEWMERCLLTRVFGMMKELPPPLRPSKSVPATSPGKKHPQHSPRLSPRSPAKEESMLSPQKQDSVNLQCTCM